MCNCRCFFADLSGPPENQIVSVDGELSEIFFDTCGWFFEVDDTLHYISGIDDLGSPELEVVDMTDDDSACDRDRMGASATADCYRCVSVSCLLAGVVRFVHNSSLSRLLSLPG